MAMTTMFYDDSSSCASVSTHNEAHVGMSSEAHAVTGTYRDFADTHLRRIADLGYSAVQLMAVADHASTASCRRATDQLASMRRKRCVGCGRTRI